MSDINFKTIAVTVTKEQDMFLNELVEYNAMSKSHFVRLAIRLLQEQLGQTEDENGK